MPREPDLREIADWKEHPVTKWWFEKMQVDAEKMSGLRVDVDLENAGKTAMRAAYSEGLRAGFAWAVNWEPEREEEA